jgi:hypothetical protein
VEAIDYAIGDLLNVGFGEHISELCSGLAEFTCNPLCG